MDSFDARESARVALKYTDELIQRFGARLAGSETGRQAAIQICADLSEICGEAQAEDFQTRPAAFMRFHRVSYIFYVAAIVLLWLRQPFGAALSFLIVLLIGELEFGIYKEIVDPLFAEKSCTNVWAALEPQGEAQRQVIISGHHDSAYELTFLRRHQKLYALKIILPDFFQFLGIVYAWYWAAFRLVTGGDPAYWSLTVGVIALGSLSFIPKLFLAAPWGTPGAGDNLIATAITVELARRLALPGQKGKSHLANTRVIFASFDAEEAGLRGSRIFARRHKEELQRLPTAMLNIDSIYKRKEIQLLSNDLNGTVNLDAEVVAECLEIAAALGIPARRMKMVFGGGATDACELAKVGVRATTLIAMPTGLIRDGLAYHTMNDTVAAIEPEAVEACLAIAWEWVRRERSAVK